MQRALQVGNLRPINNPPSFRLVFDKRECLQLLPVLTLNTSKHKQVEVLLGKKHNAAAQVSRLERVCVRTTSESQPSPTPKRADHLRHGRGLNRQAALCTWPSLRACALSSTLGSRAGPAGPATTEKRTSSKQRLVLVEAQEEQL